MVMTAIGIVVGIIGFLLMSLLVKRVGKNDKVWVLVAIVTPSLLPKVFLAGNLGTSYILGWMLAISVLVAIQFARRERKRNQTAK